MVCLVVTACGGSGDDTSGAATATTTTSSATTAAASQACADAAALKASVAELDQLDPSEAGKAGIQAALDKVSTKATCSGSTPRGFTALCALAAERLFFAVGASRYRQPLLVVRHVAGRIEQGTT